MAFRSAIEGLDKVIRSDILPPKVILVTGPPGSMKTSFCYTLMSRYLKDTGEFGLYTTLEETVQSHLRNMESLGVELSMNMQISDFTDLREIDAVVGPEDQTDYLAFIERMIGHYRKVHGHKFKLFALDSLGALYSLMENTNNMRKRMFYFFKMLRDNDLTSLVVMERTPNGEPAPRERGVSRRRHRDAGIGPVPREARPVSAGREDAIRRSLDGEACDRGPEGRADRPRSDLRRGGQFMRYAHTPTPGGHGAMHEQRRAP